jgi:hypothetical protein
MNPGLHRSLPNELVAQISRSKNPTSAQENKQDTFPYVSPPGGSDLSTVPPLVMHR